MSTTPFPETDFRLVKSEVRELDSEQALSLAEEYASLPRCDSERPLNEKHVSFLAERFKTGLMLPFCWSDVKCADVTYRVNGQHSSNALRAIASLLNGNKVTFHLDHYEAGSLKGIALLHTLFDASKQTRSKLDISHSWQGTSKRLVGKDQKTCKLLADGVIWFRKTVEKSTVAKGDYTYQLFGEEPLHAFFEWACKLLVPTKTQEMNLPSIAAAMYGTYSKNEIRADDFWRHVAKSVSLGAESPDSPANTKPDHPGTLLYADLKVKKEKVFKPNDLYAKSIYAWNSFVLDKPIRSLPPYNKKKGFPEIGG